MYRECCPECGHLLSSSRRTCPFCDWEENSDQYSFTFKVENDLSYSESIELNQDQLPGF